MKHQHNNQRNRLLSCHSCLVKAGCVADPSCGGAPVPLTLYGLEGVLGTTQGGAELGEDRELGGLPHGPLPQDGLGLQQGARHTLRLSLLHALAAVVQSFQPRLLTAAHRHSTIIYVTCITIPATAPYCSSQAQHNHICDMHYYESASSLA